jgi:hypothetical protein
MFFARWDGCVDGQNAHRLDRMSTNDMSALRPAGAATILTTPSPTSSIASSCACAGEDALTSRGAQPPSPTGCASTSSST